MAKQEMEVNSKKNFKLISPVISERRVTINE